MGMRSGRSKISEGATACFVSGFRVVGVDVGTSGLLRANFKGLSEEGFST